MRIIIDVTLNMNITTSSQKYILINTYHVLNVNLQL